MVLRVLDPLALSRTCTNDVMLALDSGGMTINKPKFRMGLMLCAAILALGSAACTTNDSTPTAATGPGIEGPAGVPGGGIPSGLGGAGNGGGVSGGGAGVGGVGQGAR